jgi:tRNA (guanine-N7-)-methyltransferase
MNIRSKPRSFVLRKGRVTSAQQDALTTLRSKFILEDTCKKLDFEVLFDNTNPTVVDIGFGSGETLLYLAKNNPHKNFLGIEVYLSGIGSSLRKAGLQELTNLRIINKDADLVFKENIPIQSLEGVVLFYPDPWQKRKHHKRRLIQKDFLESINLSLLVDGFIYCKTDWEDYAKHISTVFKSVSGWDKNLITDLAVCYQEIPSTRYEKKALREGRVLNDLVYRKV